MVLGYENAVKPAVRIQHLEPDLQLHLIPELPRIQLNLPQLKQLLNRLEVLLVPGLQLDLLNLQLLVKLLQFLDRQFLSVGVVLQEEQLLLIFQHLPVYFKLLHREPLTRLSEGTHTQSQIGEVLPHLIHQHVFNHFLLQLLLNILLQSLEQFGAHVVGGAPLPLPQVPVSLMRFGFRHLFFELLQQDILRITGVDICCRSLGAPSCPNLFASRI